MILKEKTLNEQAGTALVPCRNLVPHSLPVCSLFIPPKLSSWGLKAPARFHAGADLSTIGRVSPPSNRPAQVSNNPIIGGVHGHRFL